MGFRHWYLRFCDKMDLSISQWVLFMYGYIFFCIKSNTLRIVKLLLYIVNYVTKVVRYFILHIYKIATVTRTLKKASCQIQKYSYWVKLWEFELHFPYIHILGNQNFSLYKYPIYIYGFSNSVSSLTSGN